MLGFLRLWRLITLCENLWFKRGLKQSYSPRQELCNDMLHTTYMQENLVDSWLLVVGNQIANLTPGPSFGHNLCFKCLNGPCKPILEIYISIAFHWYKELLNAMGFDPCNHTLKLQEFTRTPTPKVGVPLGVWRSIPPHSLALPLPFLARNLGTPCLGRKPKARVVTMSIRSKNIMSDREEHEE
jgi:hypothetical protein